MKNQLLKSMGADVPVIIVAPTAPSAVRIAPYKDEAGQTIVSNADYVPHSITDGKKMQALGSARGVMSKREVSRLLSVGQCPACNSKLVATANTVDSIEIAGTDFHCPMCCASVHPVVNYVDLANALAAEVTGEDDDEDVGDDDVDGGAETDPDDSTDTYDDMDGDSDDSDDDSFYPKDSDDDSTDDDEDGDEESAAVRAVRRAVVASRRRRQLRRGRTRTVAADDDDTYADPSVDENDPDYDPDLDADYVPADEGDYDPEADDAEDVDDSLVGDDGDEDDDFNQAVAAFSKEVRRVTGRQRDRRQSLGSRRTRERADDMMDPMLVDTDDHEDQMTPGTDVDEEEVLLPVEAKNEIARAHMRVRRAAKRLRALSSVDSGDEPDVVMGPNDGAEIKDEKDADVKGVPVMDKSKKDLNDEATARVRRAHRELVEARIDLEVALDKWSQPTAGVAKDNPSIRKMNEEARARLRDARGARIDGNAPLKSAMAKAGVEDDALVDPLGLESDYGEMPIQPETPGTTDPTMDTDPLDDVDDPTPGTKFTAQADGKNGFSADNDDEGDATGDDAEMGRISALAAVDWRRAKVEIVATASGTKYVFANDRPVAILDKSLASSTVVAQWDTPVMTKAFTSACQRGLPTEEAREFGVRPHRFTVSGNDVVRHAIRNAHVAAAEKSRREIETAKSRFQQSVRTAFLGTLKGAFSTVANPMRDALVARLAQVGVTEPRSVVDTAIASSVESTLANVFTKAEELANKEDVARNEVAQFVAEASYQGRVDPSQELAEKLAQGNRAAATASAKEQRLGVASVEEANAPVDLTSRIHGHLLRVARRG